MSGLRLIYRPCFITDNVRSREEIHMPEVQVLTREGGFATIVHDGAGALAGGFQGPVLLPDSAGYDETRAIWNAMIDRRPALIARCTNSADVALAVKFARAHNLILSVRGGGHNIAGNAVCDDGLMIDLSLMRSVRVDP